MAHRLRNSRDREPSGGSGVSFRNGSVAKSFGGSARCGNARSGGVMGGENIMKGAGIAGVEMTGETMAVTGGRVA